MKPVTTLALLVVLVSVARADIEGLTKGCPDKPQPPNDAGCMYYCKGESGDWVYGVYPDESRCDYQASRDGVCQGGLCYPGSNPAPPPHQPRNQPGNPGSGSEDDGDWEDK